MCNWWLKYRPQKDVKKMYSTEATNILCQYLPYEELVEMRWVEVWVTDFPFILDIIGALDTLPKNQRNYDLH